MIRPAPRITHSPARDDGDDSSDHCHPEPPEDGRRTPCLLTRSQGKH